MDFPGGLDGKAFAYNVGDPGSSKLSHLFTAYQSVHLLKDFIIYTELYNHWASSVTQEGKNMAIMQETWVQFLGQGDPLEKDMATPSSILAWRIPQTGAWRATVHGVTKSPIQLRD